MLQLRIHYSPENLPVWRVQEPSLCSVISKCSIFYPALRSCVSTVSAVQDCLKPRMKFLKLLLIVLKLNYPLREVPFRLRISVFLLFFNFYCLALRKPFSLLCVLRCYVFFAHSPRKLFRTGTLCYPLNFPK